MQQLKETYAKAVAMARRCPAHPRNRSVKVSSASSAIGRTSKTGDTKQATVSLCWGKIWIMMIVLWTSQHFTWGFSRKRLKSID